MSAKLHRITLIAGIALGWSASVHANPAGLYVTSDSNEVLRYNYSDGSFQESFAGGGGNIDKPRGLRIGPGNDLFVTNNGSDTVSRFDGTDGSFVETFAGGGDGSGLTGPVGLTFQPGGDLFVTSRPSGNDEVLRYKRSDGSPQGVFAGGSDGSGLDGITGATFGPNGDLYVNTTSSNDQVFRYDGSDGSFLGVFAGDGNADLTNPYGITFGPGGDLFVSSLNQDNVLRYAGPNASSPGDFIETFVKSNANGGLQRPIDLSFDGPDGDLYVTSFDTGEVLRYDRSDGSFVGTFASSPGLNQPAGLTFVIPTPATLALLGPAGLILLRRRGR